MDRHRVTGQAVGRALMRVLQQTITNMDSAGLELDVDMLVSLDLAERFVHSS